jgi:hypothetical protein
MRNCRFPIRKGGIFHHEKEIEGLRGGVHRYAAQVSLKIDAVMMEKNPFRTETNYLSRTSRTFTSNVFMLKGF